MTEASELTAKALLEAAGGDPGDLVTASGLLAGLGPDHPLYLPLTVEADVWADFSKLDILLAELARGKKGSKVPIDLSPLAKLCAEHEQEIASGEVWTYSFFYLELLAKEDQLRPFFWADSVVAAQLQTHPIDSNVAAWSPEVADKYQQESQEMWHRNAGRWVERGQLALPGDEPWLSHLAYRPPDAEHWEMAGEKGLGMCLYFEKLPFYHRDDAYEKLIKAMKLELWRTSVFCPKPLPSRGGPEFKQACDRFALSYRRHTQQEVRQHRFEQFVRKRYDRGMVKKAVAREAVKRKLWPYGTRKSNCEPTHDDDVENCRRVVIRLIKTREKQWLKEKA